MSSLKLQILVGTKDGYLASVKRTIPTFITKVLMPTMDTYGDLSLIIPWVIASHYYYAVSMAIPLLLQFLATIVKWNQLEKPQDKKWSWVFLILQLWPQLRALRVIKLMYNGDKRADDKKRKLQQEVYCNEAILEAVPSIFIMTIICCSAQGFHNAYLLYYYDCNTKHWNEYPNSTEIAPQFILENQCQVFGSVSRVPWFFTKYAFSIITGTLGVTKVLQFGPCPILKTDGPLGGICSFKFIMCFLSVLCSIVGKIIFGIFGAWLVIEAEKSGNIDVTRPHIVLLVFGLCVLPHLILAVISLMSITGCNKTFFKVLIGYPIFWVLPIISTFVVGPRKISCRSQCKNVIENYELGVSKVLSIINLLLQFCMPVIMAYVVPSFWKLPLFLGHFYVLVVFVPLFIILTLFFCCTIQNDSCCRTSLIDPTNSFRKLTTDGRIIDDLDGNK